MVLRYQKVVESYGLETLCECHERRRGYTVERTLAGMGDDEPILAGKRVLEKELEKLQRNLNGPKETAKHIEAKQNWINRESKRLESESAKLAEWQESRRVRKETLRVAYEKINVLRKDLLREGESMDKNKSHFMSPENTEEIRIFKQELAFWRGPASMRQAGWTRDGSVEEIAGWVLEAERLNREVEAKKRKFQQTIIKESGKDAMMGDDYMDGLCRREGANTDIASSIRVETACGWEGIRVC